MAAASDVQNPAYLGAELGKLSDEALLSLATSLRLTAPPQAYPRPALLALFLHRYCPPPPPLPPSLFSTEAALFAPPPSPQFLPLTTPYLSTQFPSYRHYLSSSFLLYQAEANDNVRSDLLDAARRCAHRRDPATGAVSKTGWSRFATDALGCAATRAGKAKIGTRHASYVEGSVEVDLASYAGHIRAEWDALQENDVVFLLSIAPKEGEVVKGKGREEASAALAETIKLVRGATVKAVHDGDGNEITQDSPSPAGASSRRVISLLLDPVQYHNDFVVNRDRTPEEL
jgi:hypothetical protein